MSEEEGFRAVCRGRLSLPPRVSWSEEEAGSGSLAAFNAVTKGLLDFESGGEKESCRRTGAFARDWEGIWEKKRG